MKLLCWITHNLAIGLNFAISNDVAFVSAVVPTKIVIRINEGKDSNLKKSLLS